MIIPGTVAASAGGLSAAQRVLNRASADGWTAVYDVTNPSTRTLVGSDVQTLQDGLGNLGSLTEVASTSRPTHGVGTFGQLDALVGTSGQHLRLASFAAAIPQPLSIMAVGKWDVIGTSYLWDGQVSTATRCAFFADGAPATWRIFASSSIVGGTTDDQPHIHLCVYNGSSSQYWRDGAQILNNVNPGAAPLDGFNVLGRQGSTGFRLNGKGACFMIRSDAIGTTARQNMFALLGELTGISVV